ncbi:hypothetical protein CU048_13760 [Beijerinckiaceae bacterium]|nr:hypothetical protein CU048_13760 [Beijerinckiaceae bacterium]
MSIILQMKKRRARFSATLAHGLGVETFEQLLKLYWADARDMADIFFDHLVAEDISRECFETEKNTAIETVRTVARNELNQLAPLLAAEKGDFDMIVAAIIDSAFERRLSERRHEAAAEDPLVV